jgi:hypothetical protein
MLQACPSKTAGRREAFATKRAGPPSDRGKRGRG